MAQNKIIQFTTADDAKKAARSVAEKAIANQQEQKSVFEGILAEVEKINPSLGGFDELAVLLTLSDEQFSMISPIFLHELEKSLNLEKSLLAILY